MPTLLDLSVSAQGPESAFTLSCTQLCTALRHTQLMRLGMVRCGLASLPPAMLRALSRLEDLDLSCNPRLCAETLNEGLQGLGPHLTTLRLDYCGLRRLPPVLGGLSALRTLSLRWNYQLSGGLEELRGTPQLTALDLRECDLEALPPALGRLAQLRRLGLSKNRRLCLGLERLGGLGQLTSLYLSGCGVLALPPAMSTLTALRRWGGLGLPWWCLRCLLS